VIPAVGPRSDSGEGQTINEIPWFHGVGPTTGNVLLVEQTRLKYKVNHLDGSAIPGKVPYLGV
jgi:hypothetical protein